MCLPAEHYLLAGLQMVPRRRPASERWSVRRSAPPGRHEEMRPLREPIPAKVQQGEILSRLCREHEAEKGHRAQEETKAELSRFRDKKALVNQGFQDRAQRGRDTFPIPPLKRASNGPQRRSGKPHDKGDDHHD